MCSPIGHSLIGLIFYYIFNKTYNLFQQWKEVLLYVFFANAPDIDFIPLLWGNINTANNWHHTYTHTIGFAIICAGIVYLLKRKDKLKLAAIVFLLVMTHLVIDYFTIDSRYPYGVMLWWPFSNQFFHASHPIFLPLKKGTIGSLISWLNLRTAASEIITFGPILALLFLLRLLQAKRQISSQLKFK